MLTVALVTGVFTVPANASPRQVAVDNVRMRIGDDPAWAVRNFDDSNWVRSPLWDVDPQGHILWLRAPVDAPAGVDVQTMPVAVHIMMAASWELYWNGTLIGRNGTPGATPQAEVPGRIEGEVFVPPELLLARDNVLAMRISTQHPGAGLRAPIQYLAVGPLGGATGGTLRGNDVAALAAGPLILGALYFAVMFAMNRRDTDSLLLSLLAMAVLGQLVTESLRGFYPYSYPLHVLRLQTILAFALLSSLLLVAYVARHYARRHLWMAVGTSCATGICAALFAPGYDGKTTLILFAGTIITLTLSLIGRRARLAGAGATALALVATLLVMILGLTQFLDVGYYLIATALLLFLFARQAVELRRSQQSAGAAALRTAQLELELVKQKIQPHFLMNTLTALAELVESSPHTGVRMIDALAEEFRTVSSMSGRALVSLREELDLCRQHLAVMGFRGARHYELHTEGVDLDASLPPAVLHTLIENALTHNRYVQGAAFTLDARREQGRWTYRLRSPRDQPDTAGPGNGTGHEYVCGRLHAAYGDAAQFRAGPLSIDTWEDVIIVPAVQPP